MGVKEIRDAFNEVTGADARCVKALLEYAPDSSGTIQWQILYFSGNYRDGTGFSIKSSQIRPGGSVILAARETAERLLAEKGST